MSIVKKIMVIILVVALCLSGVALAEETAAPVDIMGEWVEYETQFTRMTIEKNPEMGWDVEIASPLTHGAYVFKTTVQYDGDQFTYNKGKFWEVPITDEANPELGEAKIAGTSGTFAITGDDQNVILIWVDDSRPEKEVRFERVDAGENEIAMSDTAAAFQGVWQCDRASIAMYWEEEGFKVLITWGSSAWEETEWEYSCFYHGEDNTVVSMPFGTRKDVVYNDEGEIASVTEAYNDGEAVFSLDEEGKLIWQDQKENAGEGMRFEKLPEEPADLTFATIGDAMNSEGFTGIAGGDDEHYVAVVEMDGAYLRVVANVDDEARRLNEDILNVDVDMLESAFDAYNAYIATLPIAYEEEITAQPLSHEELDALAGKTLLEVEEAGFESSSSEMGENDETIYTVCYGLYDYSLLLNETYTEYMEHDDNGFIGDLTVKSASFAGISRNAMELRYHADGTVDEADDPWAEFNAVMEMITEAISSENPEEAIQALTEVMPEHADEIRMFAEIFATMSQQNEE